MRVFNRAGGLIGFTTHQPLWHDMLLVADNGSYELAHMIHEGVMHPEQIVVVSEDGPAADDLVGWAAI